MDSIMVIRILMGLFNDSGPLEMNPPPIRVLDQAFVGILPPEGRNQMVLLQKIAGLVHQSQITTRGKTETLSQPMVSVQEV